MDTKLTLQAIIKFLCGFILVGTLIFLPAGTLDYCNGWLLMCVLFIPIFILELVLLLRSPELLKKRLNGKERAKEQQWVVKLSGLMFVTSFVIAGLNYRYCWYLLPSWLSYSSTLVFLLSYLAYAEVLRENSYLSRTIEVQDGQRVIDSGLYGIIRHPMYATTLLLFLSMPLILGSPISFIIMLAYIPIIAVRIRNEEQILERELVGYKEYKTRVRYKIIPYIW